MESAFTTKCVNGHDAYKMCVKLSCPHPSGICSTQGCEYESVHEKCNDSTEVSQVYASLMRFAHDQSVKTDELILGSINKMIKNLEILKNQYLALYSKLQHQLKCERRTLFQLMKNGPVSNINPHAVSFDLYSRLPTKIQTQTFANLKEISERVFTQHCKGLDQIRKWLKSGDSIHFAFTKNLTHHAVVTLSQQNTKVTQHQNNHNVNSLLTPSISQSGYKKILLKLNTRNKQNYLSIGVARKQQLVSRNFNWPLYNKGIYNVHEAGYTLNHLNPSQHKKNLDFKFTDGDILEMEYFEFSESLMITSLTTGKSLQLEGIGNKEKDLHYCVETYKMGDEWEVVERVGF